MIDNFSLAITHALMLLAAYILLRRPDLDRDNPEAPKTSKRRWGRSGDA